MRLKDKYASRHLSRLSTLIMSIWCCNNAPTQVRPDSSECRSLARTITKIWRFGLWTNNNFTWKSARSTWAWSRTWSQSSILASKASSTSTWVRTTSTTWHVWLPPRADPSPSHQLLLENLRPSWIRFSTQGSHPRKLNLSPSCVKSSWRFNTYMRKASVT